MPAGDLVLAAIAARTEHIHLGSAVTVLSSDDLVRVIQRYLSATRFDLKYGAGGLSHETLMTNIELYGRQVIPRVRELTKE